MLEHRGEPSEISIETLIKLKMVVMPSGISIETLIKGKNSGRGSWSDGGELVGHLIPSQISFFRNPYKSKNSKNDEIDCCLTR